MQVTGVTSVEQELVPLKVYVEPSPPPCCVQVTGMTSVEQELVPLKVHVNTVQAKGSVERWLLEVEERMFEAVHDVTSQGIAAYPGKPRHTWVLDWPGMVVLVVAGVYWTRLTEKALQEGQVKACEKQCTDDLMRVGEDGGRGED